MSSLKDDGGFQMDDYGPDYITISDEDGKEYELEVLAELEYQGASYLAVTDAAAEEAEEMEVSILKSVEEDGEEILLAVEDDEELETVYGMFMELIYEEDEES